MKRKFSISVVARLKHGILREALRKRGWTQRYAAEFLEMSEHLFGQIVNLKHIPKNLTLQQEIKFEQLTGMRIDELFPKEVFSKEFLQAPKILEAIREMPIYALASKGIIALPPTPEEFVQKRELSDALDKALRELLPRQEAAIRRVLIEGETLQEVGNSFMVSRETVRNRIKAGVKKIRRNPRLRRSLKMFLPD